MDKYSSYKDSGVKWLGDIPSHWKINRIANYFTERKTKVSDKDYAPLSVTKMGILPQLDNVAKTNDEDNRKMVKVNDFVINSRSDRRGSSGVSLMDGSVSLINIVLEPRPCISLEYCNYLLKSYSFVEEFYRNGHGIVADLWTTRYDEMKTIKICIPPYQEQERISSYLDAATAKIDEAIAQQQRMIDLLNERKQIVINNAVTRGVSSCITYRESGYDWIGVIPSHWEIRKLKYYVTPSREKAYKALPYIGLENIESHTGKFILTDSEYDINQSLLCNKNDVIFGKLRPYLAKAYLCDRNYCCSNEFVVMRDTPVPKFLQYVLLSTYFVNKVDASTYGAKMPCADIDYILNLPIAIPPVNEQGEIVRSVNEQFSIIDKMIAPKAKLLSLLQERKQIIINDVVTGKVKVF